MENSKTTATSIDSGERFTRATKESEIFNQELYQSEIGSIPYLSTRTRSVIAYAVGNVERFRSQPTRQHWRSVKHIMRYLNGTRNYGLLYNKENVNNLMG